MELRHLKSFVTLAETLHFGKAATRLHISQPPLSQQIQRLERELGLLLFERSRQSVSLTGAGAALLPWAEKALEACSEVVDVAQQLRRGRTGTLEIGHISSAMLGELPRLVQSFNREYPNISLSLTQLASHEQLHALRTGKIDVAVCRILDEKPEDLQVMTITREPLVAAVHTSSKIATGDTAFSLEQFSGMPLIGPSRESTPSYWPTVLDLCSDYGFEPNIVEVSSNILNISGFVAAGLGVAIVPASTARMPFPEVTFLEIDHEKAFFPLHLAWIEQDGFPALDRFLSMVLSIVASH